MTALDASAIAALLREFGQRSALRGGNPFRAKAYGRAADNLLALSLPLDQIIAQDRLREIPGIGDAIADIIKKLQATGTHPALEKMRKEIPSGVLEMLTIPGLRADKVIKLYQELGLTSLEELEQAAREGRLQTVKGLGASLQTKVLSGIELRREARGRRHMHKADELLRSPKASQGGAAGNHPNHRSGRFPSGLGACGRSFACRRGGETAGGPKAITAGGQLTAHLTDATHYGVTLLLATAAATIPRSRAAD
jgi:DNA polymerase (family X)